MGVSLQDYKAYIKKAKEVLGITQAEAEDMFLYDMKCEKGKATEYELTAEQKKNAKKYTNSKKGVSGKQRERAENLTKKSIIEILSAGIETLYEVVVEITNAERQFTFQKDNETYEVTVVQNRKKK